MERARHPSGTIRRRKDVAKTPWQAIVKYPNGTTGWKTQSKTFARKGEAQAWLDSTLAEARNTPDYRAPSAQTLGEYLNYWLHHVKKGQIADTTWADYDRYVTTITTQLGDRALARLTPLDVQDLYGRLASQGDGPRTVHYVHQVLHQALEMAVDFGLVLTNVSRKVPSPKIPRKALEPPSLDAAGKLLQAADSHPLRALWYFFITTGCRRSEALGLQWGDVDWTAKTVLIQRALVEKSKLGVSVHKIPKTSKSYRTIDLSEDYLEILQAHREQQTKHREAQGEQWHDDGWVFATRTGTWIRPNNCNQTLTRLLKSAGLPHARPHQLRHFMATQWVAAGKPIPVVAQRLGHASADITFRIYAHAVPTQQADAAKDMDAKILGSIPDPSPGTNGSGPQNGRPGQSDPSLFRHHEREKPQHNQEST